MTLDMFFDPFYLKAIVRTPDPFRHQAPGFEAEGIARTALRGVYRQGATGLQALGELRFRNFGVNRGRIFSESAGIMTRDYLNIRGFRIYRGLLDTTEQAALVEDLRGVVAQAPMFSPMTPYGKPMRVRMTSAGKYGWMSDKRGYRYVTEHPDGRPWPAIPGRVLEIWQELVSAERGPDCCLVNYYGEGAKMGLHQDRDEADFSWPVLSISLGDEGLFRIGNTTRGGKTESIWLLSGDVVLMGGAARLTYHGVDKIRFGSSSLLEKGGRINLTCRVVD